VWAPKIVGWKGVNPKWQSRNGYDGSWWTWSQILEKCGEGNTIVTGPVKTGHVGTNYRAAPISFFTDTSSTKYSPKKYPQVQECLQWLISDISMTTANFSGHLSLSYKII